MDTPLVSVVMPSMNHAAFITAAIDSILSQSYANLEIWVADGGSTDATVAWLKSKQVEDHRLRWFSEPDSGPANALNKALHRARGTIIGWLNSDDLYTPDAINRAVEAFAANPRWQMLYGHGDHIDVAGNFIDHYPTLTPETNIEVFGDGCFICQPTVYFKRTLPILLGPLDERLKTAFDFDYWLRAFTKLPGRIGFIDAVQAYSRLHEDSITLRMRRTVALEGIQLLARHLGHAPSHWLLTYADELRSQAAAQNMPASELHRQLLELLDEVVPLFSHSEIAFLRKKLLGDLHEQTTFSNP
jgi:glycosyltransferase involved in cell wall biosynthesis